MDAVLLARIQFAITIGFHFIFPPLTIGLAWLIVWFIARFRRTGDLVYQHLARFWIQLFAVTFAVGVATGLTMEFQFGTNWAQYSRVVGDIFGAPLAAEAVFAFFLESTFLGILLFGWNRVSCHVRLFAAFMVALGATTSAFWIIVANSWMQTPTGFVIRNGRAELANFWEATFNPSTIPRFLHTLDGALVTGAFFMLGIGAWYLLKGRQQEDAKVMVKLGLVVGFAASVLQLGLGHYHAIQVAQTQPLKLAAFEGLFTTTRRAPLLLFGVIDGQQEKVHYPLAIPWGLSVFVSGNPEHEVQGLRDFPKDEWPPLALTFYPFHLMVVLGMFFIAFPALGLFLLWRKKLFHNRYYLLPALFSIPLPFVVNELGWITAEVGRQPWIVYNVMRTSEAISSNVSAESVLLSIITFSVLYLLLFIAWILALRFLLARGIDHTVTATIPTEVV